MDAPIILVVSCSDFNPTDLALDIIGRNANVNAVASESTHSTFCWIIDNKYYNASVQIVVLHAKHASMYNAPATLAAVNKFIPSLNALILIFDSSKRETFEEAKCWYKVLNNDETPVNILVTNTCRSTDAVSKENIWSWCLDKGFELVELNPVQDNDEDDDETEDDFKETVGVPRIVQALNAHTWPNLNMKDEPSARVTSSRKADVNMQAAARDSNGGPNSGPQKDAGAGVEHQQQSAANGVHLHSNDGSSSNCTTANGNGNAASGPAEDVFSKFLSAEEAQLLTALEGNDENDSFENLFSRLALMKERASQLTGDERRQYAEQVATSFWKAIGGDMEEIDGLSSDEDN